MNLRTEVLGVGKSALTIRFYENKFVSDYDPTIEQMCRIHTSVDDLPLELHVLDVSEVDEYAHLRDSYLRTSDGIMLVYAVDSMDSFEKLSGWHQRIQVATNLASKPLIVVANKCDVKSGKEVTSKNGLDFADRLGALFFETSALTGHNVVEAFHGIIRGVRRWAAHARAQQTNPLSSRLACCVIL